jgi:hypothetical protein
MVGYTLLLAVTACFLVRFVGVWDDVRTVLRFWTLLPRAVRAGDWGASEFHLTSTAMFVVGAAFDDRLGRLLRTAGAATALFGSMVAMTGRIEQTGMISSWMVEVHQHGERGRVAWEDRRSKGQGAKRPNLTGDGRGPALPRGAS